MQTLGLLQPQTQALPFGSICQNGIESVDSNHVQVGVLYQPTRFSLTPNLGVQDEHELGQLFDRRQTYPIG